MNRSDFMRGLAVTAVGALALSGIGSAAHANTVDEQVTSGKVVLYSQSSQVASVNNDGADSTVRLEAGAGANINQVTFQYQIHAAGNWQDIQTVSRNDNGAFSYEWAPPAALGGATIDIRVIGTTTTGTAATPDEQDSVLVKGDAASVSINDGDALGVYQSPITNEQSVVVSGTTSAANQAVTVSLLDGTGAPTTATFAANSGATKAFTGVLDLAGAYTYGATDQVVLGATATGGSDDVAAFGLYKQVITTVTATPKATKVPAGGNTPVTVTVLDQNGKPVAGAEVRDGTNALVGFTGADGTVTKNQGVGTAFYFANANNDTVFTPELGDKKSADVTITQYAPAPVDLKGTSADGAAFDRDEYAGGDITVNVLDSEGAVFDSSQQLSYRWVFTPFAGGPAVTTNGGPIADVAGTFTVPLPAGEGTFELYASLAADNLGNNPIAEKKVLTVKAGQAVVKYDGAPKQTALVGTTTTVTGKLVLADGTALGGRDIAVSYLAGAAGADATPDAALVAPVPTKTAADGTFSVAVKDIAANESETELGGKVTVTPTGIAPAADQGVDFLTDQVPAGAVVTVDEDGAGKPGIAETGTVTVEDKDGNPLKGVQVTVAVDHGFLTDGTPDPAPAKDGLTGEYKSLGDHVTVATDSNGEATFQTAIERDNGFDEDGKVTAKATATVDGVSGDDTIEWDTTDPLNYSEVSVVRTPDVDQEGPVDPAPVGNSVWYDVYAKDQFGNPVAGADVDVTLTDPSSADHPLPVFGGAGDSDFDNGGDLSVWSAKPGVYHFQADLDYIGHVYNAVPAPSTPSKTVSATFEQEWYAAVPTDLSIARTPAGDSVDLGATVSETVTVIDQEGNPMPGLHVDFVRTGDPNETRFDTDEAGQATYVFRAADAGVETVTAVIRTGSGTVVDTLEDSFGVNGPAVEYFASASNAKNGDDRVKVFADNGADSAGAPVDLFKKVDGVWKQIGPKDAILGPNGRITFVVADRNGDQVTKYRAEVDGVKTNKTSIG